MLRIYCFCSEDYESFTTGFHDISLKYMYSNVFQAMMRQSHKIEKFKSTQNVEDAIHAKFDSRTLSPVVGDNEEVYIQFLLIR